jgi:hypothetical protein
VKELQKNAHFDDQRWVDFVRGIAAEAVQKEMQTHLDSGCPSCRATFSWMGSVATLAAADSAILVPEDVVQKARELFVASPAPAGWIETLESIAAELISEVRWDWQPTGVRSGGASAETPVGDRLLFRAGDYAVDLKIEPPSVSDAGEIIGQIANQVDQQENLEGVVVQMVVLGRTLGETATNRFGEFLIEYPTGKKATLRLALKHRGQRIDLPLKAV